jgi:hypothetical protein
MAFSASVRRRSGQQVMQASEIVSEACIFCLTTYDIHSEGEMKSEHTERRTASGLDESVSQSAKQPAATDRRASALRKGLRRAAETGRSSDRAIAEESEDGWWDVQPESTSGVYLLIV